LVAAPVKCLGNLKYASAPLSFDAAELAALRQQTRGREIWLMASTHHGEETMAIAAHRTLAAQHPRVLTVIVPRHVARGDEIARLLDGAGLRFARRSRGEALTADTAVYLADTMGELGLFYSLCPIAVVGGSFVRIGGHNPIEPAQLGGAIIFGPYMYKNSEIAREFLFAQAALQLQNDNEIAFAVDRLLTDAPEREKRAQAARLLADQKRHVLDQIVRELDVWLGCGA
jgi:3-deoxy-D-manno-octulosonic-acid transferase